jgi:hypothetical protein
VDGISVDGSTVDGTSVDGLTVEPSSHGLLQAHSHANFWTLKFLQPLQASLTHCPLVQVS